MDGISDREGRGGLFDLCFGAKLCGGDSLSGGGVAGRGSLAGWFIFLMFAGFTKLWGTMVDLGLTVNGFFTPGLGGTTAPEVVGLFSVNGCIFGRVGRWGGRELTGKIFFGGVR